MVFKQAGVAVPGKHARRCTAFPRALLRMKQQFPMQMSSMKRRVLKKMTLPFGSTIEPSLVLVHTIRRSNLTLQRAIRSPVHRHSTCAFYTFALILLHFGPVSLRLVALRDMLRRRASLVANRTKRT